MIIMKRDLKNILSAILVSATIFSIAAGSTAYAQGILPSGKLANGEEVNCNELVNAEDTKSAFNSKQGFDKLIEQGQKDGLSRNESFQLLLGCAIKTGRIRMYMMPYFLIYLIEFLLRIAGIISVLFVAYGGFKYTVGGLMEDKDSGKKIITYALMGLVVSLSAWILVNFVQIALTS